MICCCYNPTAPRVGGRPATSSSFQREVTTDISIPTEHFPREKAPTACACTSAMLKQAISSSLGCIPVSPPSTLSFCPSFLPYTAWSCRSVDLLSTNNTQVLKNSVDLLVHLGWLLGGDYFDGTSLTHSLPGARKAYHRRHLHLKQHI